jgi:hypothetical protein
MSIIDGESSVPAAVDVPPLPAVSHISRSDRCSLAEVLGGGEARRMTPDLAANISVLDEPLACWMVEDSSTMEVNLLDRYLDLLAAAELPSTGEQIQVAIENQYGVADPDHFGRLVGWYMPETGAQMGVLVAEDFDPQLVKAVADGQIVRPEHGLWLVEACGYLVGDAPVVTYTTRACSLARTDQLDRQRAFARGRAGGGRSTGDQAEAYRRAAAMFEYLARTSVGWLSQAPRQAGVTTGYYRTLIDNGDTVRIELFVGSDRISVGSCYFKSTFDEATLEALVTANQETEVDPPPDKRYLRGSWWNLRLDLGRDTPQEQWPADLGNEIERGIDAIRSTIDTHQAALKAVASL